MSLDAHFHAWQPARGDYGWLTPALGPLWREVQVPHWWHEAAPHGVQGGVLVQAAPTAAETDFLLAQAAAHPRVLGVVGWVDLTAPDAPAQVRARAAQPRLVGLRPMLQDLADTDWIAQPAVQPALAAMAECGLVLDALIQPRHLPVLQQVARAHPGLRIVIDHGAKPRMDAASAPGSAAWQAWAQGLQALADLAPHGRIVCKLSGLWTEAPAGQPCAHVQAWAQALLHIWGPQRLLWGSDWPVLEQAGPYAAWWAHTQALLAPLSPAERQAVLGENARRVYRLEDPLRPP
jgi:L-fuconolactonase